MANGVALLAATWFWNGGLSGPDTMVALAALVALLTVMDRSPYRNVGIIFVPLMSLLFLMDSSGLGATHAGGKYQVCP